MVFLGGLIAAGVNYDIVAVWLLSLINAPGYQEARRIAGLIYAHPEQWTIARHGVMEHASFGAIRYCHRPGILEVDGKGFGEWEPSGIERRIIYNAARWHQRHEIRRALGA